MVSSIYPLPSALLDHGIASASSKWTFHVPSVRCSPFHDHKDAASFHLHYATINSQGIDYTLPDTPYVLRYYSPRRRIPVVTLDLDDIATATDHAANIYAYLSARYTPETQIDFGKSGVMGGKTDEEGISIHITKPAFADPTYGDAENIMKGIRGAAYEKDCWESARVVVFKREEGKRNAVLAFVDLGPEVEDTVREVDVA